ncbi:hypothetical protein BCV69DRAFT_50354 [Microstroma glucosiphilum]|uniref:Uncharacterized protein n=1 Tax=Pseudomicrostroma glucosiphilum TaxID=1684307 RepID=A0A316U3E2_9BASI|nr:hypothetical protein BCV69DRAFT_50354 [Pseudomicrostroma glucosiphilum]PWN19314.1 hypothetical protein BCV69DRAFT_50354 [Pseudomicrostroma glucosiphilum]
MAAELHRLILFSSPTQNKRRRSTAPSPLPFLACRAASSSLGAVLQRNLTAAAAPLRLAASLPSLLTRSPLLPPSTTMVATATADNSWQPGEIPSTIGASLQSWLRPNHQPRVHHHHHKGHDATNGNSSTSASSNTSASASSSSLSASQQQQDKEARAAVISAEASVGNDPAAAQATLPAPGVALTYPGKWDQLSAQAELYLYAAATPYFRGAHLGNVQNPLHSSDVGAFSGMWEQASGKSTGKDSQAESGAHSKRFPAEHRATIGTALHKDGKVGSIRWVAADPEFKEVKQNEANGTASSNGHAHGSGWLRWLTGASSSTTPAKCLNVLEIGRPEITREEEEREEKIVVLAGYGAGIAFFYRVSQLLKDECLCLVRTAD